MFIQSLSAIGASVLFFRPDWLHLVQHSLFVDSVCALLIAIAVIPWVRNHLED